MKSSCTYHLSSSSKGIRRKPLATWILLKSQIFFSPQFFLLGMFKHYLITRLSEQDEDLRARYIANEKIFALVLGIVPEGQAKVRESLSYTAYKNMLKNILRYKDTVEPQDLQQFVILKDSLQLGQFVQGNNIYSDCGPSHQHCLSPLSMNHSYPIQSCSNNYTLPYSCPHCWADQATADKVLDEASRGAVVEHAASFLRPKGDSITAEMAQRFRGQVSTALSIHFRLLLVPSHCGRGSPWHGVKFGHYWLLQLIMIILLTVLLTQIRFAACCANLDETFS